MHIVQSFDVQSVKIKPGDLGAVATFLPRANEVWGKVMFLHVSVILFTGGEYLGRYPPWAGTPPG